MSNRGVVHIGKWQPSVYPSLEGGFMRPVRKSDQIGNCMHFLTGLLLCCLSCPRLFSQVALSARSTIGSNPAPSAQRFVNSIRSSMLNFETIDYPGALATRALGINAQGTVTGSFD